MWFVSYVYTLFYLWLWGFLLWCYILRPTPSCICFNLTLLMLCKCLWICKVRGSVEPKVCVCCIPKAIIQIVHTSRGSLSHSFANSYGVIIKQQKGGDWKDISYLKCFGANDNSHYGLIVCMILSEQFCICTHDGMEVLYNYASSKMDAATTQSLPKKGLGSLYFTRGRAFRFLRV